MGRYVTQREIEREFKRVYPTECHACQEYICPSADECDVCKMKDKPARTLHEGAQ